MLRSTRGFTLVEILIVISVLGILMTIASISWGAYVSFTEDRARESDTRQWASTFDLYKSRFFVYPIMPTSSATADAGIACLGAIGSFPTAAGASTGADKCGQYKSTDGSSFTTTSTALGTAIEKVSAVPKNSHQESGRTIVKSTYVGPFVYVTQTSNTGTIPVTARFANYFKGSCPSGFTESTNLSVDFPRLSSVKITGDTSVKVCFIKKDFTYTLN